MAADVPHLPPLEDDLAEPGLIAPVGLVPCGPMPRAVVVCFFAEVIQQLMRRDDAELVGVQVQEPIGPTRHRSVSTPTKMIYEPLRATASRPAQFQ